MEELKYKLTEESIVVCNKTLYRIEALKDFGDVKKGDKGGYVENEDNLSQYDDCWIYGVAKVYDDAKVYGNARICGDATIASSSDYIVFKNWWSSGRYFTWTRSNDMWKVGCFYGTGKQLIQKAYKDSKSSGEEYERIVRYVDSIKKKSAMIWNF